MAAAMPATKSQKHLHEIHPGGGPPRLAPRPPRPGAALRKACARLGYGARRGRPVSCKDWAEVAAVIKNSIDASTDTKLLTHRQPDRTDAIINTDAAWAARRHGEARAEPGLRQEAVTTRGDNQQRMAAATASNLRPEASAFVPARPPGCWAPAGQPEPPADKVAGRRHRPTVAYPTSDHIAVAMEVAAADAAARRAADAAGAAEGAAATGQRSRAVPTADGRASADGAEAPRPAQPARPPKARRQAGRAEAGSCAAAAEAAAGRRRRAQAERPADARALPPAPEGPPTAAQATTPADAAAAGAALAAGATPARPRGTAATSGHWAQPPRALQPGGDPAKESKDGSPPTGSPRRPPLPSPSGYVVEDPAPPVTAGPASKSCDGRPRPSPTETASTTKDASFEDTAIGMDTENPQAAPGGPLLRDAAGPPPADGRAEARHRHQAKAEPSAGAGATAAPARERAGADAERQPEPRRLAETERLAGSDHEGPQRAGATEAGFDATEHLADAGPPLADAKPLPEAGHRAEAGARAQAPAEPQAEARRPAGTKSLDQPDASQALQPGVPVRIVGLKSQKIHNGLEGTLGTLDAATGRWAVRLGSTTLCVKASCIERIRNWPKRSLAEKFQQAATSFQYTDEFLNNDVFHYLYDLAASEPQPGVFCFFRDLFQREDLFDAFYAQAAGSGGK